MVLALQQLPRPEAMQGSRRARKGRRIFLSVLVVLLAGAASVTAAIAASSAPTNRRTLTYTQSAGGPEGTGTVQSKPKGIRCGAACDEAVASMYEDETVVLKAKASNGSSLSSWSGCESSTNTGTEGTCTVKMTQDQEVKATWGNTSKAIVNPQPLTVSKGESTGTGAVNGTGALSCETECTSTTVLYQGEIGTPPKVKPGKTVTLKEAPAFGSEFSGWSGGGCSGTGETCTVTMNTAAAVTAIFAAKPITTLTVEKAGTGTGTVSSKPKALNCGTTCTSQSAAVPEEAEVMLKEKPAIGPFEGWRGACAGAGETCTVKLSAAGTVTAKFGGTAKAILNAQVLTLNKAGSGFGTIRAAGLACEVLCTSTTNLYQGPTGIAPKNKPGKTVTLKAISAPGSKQVAWTGCESESTPTECSVTMEGSREVTATFDEATAVGGSVPPELSLCGEISHDETIGPNYAERYVLTCDVTVDRGATLSVEAGAILKAEGGVGIVVNGTLQANGTASEPVTFTSLRDDTVGGDTNSDGSATAPEAGDWRGVVSYKNSDQQSLPTVTLNHTAIEYPNAALDAQDTSVSMTNGAAGHCYTRCVSVEGEESPDPTIANNAFGAAGNEAAVLSSPVALDKLGGNTFSGKEGFGAIVFAGAHVDHSGAFPATGDAMLGLEEGFVGGSIGEWGALGVDPGVTATLSAGTTVKGGNEASSHCGGCISNALLVNGTLQANGTASEPVTFTSLRDDTVGGDTNSDGSATAPEAGDWEGISVSNSGEAILNGTSIRYANTALRVDETSWAEIHGSILDSETGVSADTAVDASHVYWGTPSGPSPLGTGPAVSPSVLVVPWVGYVPPPIPPDNAPTTSQPDQSECRDVLFIGLRGSGEAPQDSSYSSDELDNMGERIPIVAQGFEHYFDDQVPNKTPYSRIRYIGIRYPAAPADNINNYRSGYFFDSMYDGARALADVINREHQRCGSTGEKIVVSGYSQGALAIHMALRSGTGPAQDVDALALVADPARYRDGEEEMFGGAATHAHGIFSILMDTSYVWAPSMAAKTVHLCHDRDPVCAWGRGAYFSGFDPHTNYEFDELEELGRRAGAKVWP